MKQLQESEILLTIAALIVGIFILDLATPLGVVVPMLYLVPLWLTIWTSPQHAPFLVAATCAVLTILGFFFSPPGQEQVSLVNRSIVLATLALNALPVWQEKKARGALLHEVEERTRAEAELITLAATLEQRVAERTTELKASRAAALNIMEDAAEAKRTAELAAEASAWLAAIVEFSGDAIISQTLDGIVTSWNKGAERLFGYTAEEMTGQPVLVLIPPGRADEEPKIIERLKRGERVEHYETVRRRKDGLEIHVSLTASPIKDATGNIVAASKIARDISERKRAEHALRIKTEQLATVTDAMTAFLESGNFREASTQLLHGALRQTESEYGFVGVVVEGPVLRILAHEGIVWSATVNREFYENAVRTYQEVGYLEFTNFDNLFGRVITSGKPVLSNDPSTDQRSGGLPQGHPPLHHFLGVPIHKGTDVVGMIGVANRPGGYTGQEQTKIEILSRAASVLYDSYRRREREIALEMERKQAEEALRISEERLRSITQSASDAIISADSSGNIVSWNNGAQTIFGYAEPEVLGRPLAMLMPERYREAHQSGLARIRSGGASRVIGTTVELHGLRKDGGEFPLELALGMWKATEGIFYSGIIRDITERKRAEEEVRRANRELAAVNAELESFSYSVSHDLRAPLRAMQGFAQALLEDYADRLDSVAQDYAQRIVGATRRMDTLMQDLLAYSRLSNADLHLRSVHLSSIVAEAQAQLEEDLQERRAQLTVEEPLPQIVGHPATLVQVVANLLANAAKFVAPGVKPQVRVWAEERGQRMRLWVEDNGIGIESEHQDRIFRVFERLHGIETYPGTGIGLAIVRKGIERMGGLVGVQSEPGRGSRFWIELPRAEQTYEHTDAHHLTGRG